MFSSSIFTAERFVNRPNGVEPLAQLFGFGQK